MNLIFFKHHWISILLGMVILYLCMMDAADLPEAPMSNFDKVVHLLMFGAVSGIVFLENSRYFRAAVSNVRLLFGSFLYPILFGGFIEVLQEYCSHCRSGDWMDFLYDVFGAFVGFWICWGINKKLQF